METALLVEGPINERIVALWKEGHSYRHIADQLNTSVGVIRGRISGMKSKGLANPRARHQPVVIGNPKRRSYKPDTDYSGPGVTCLEITNTGCRHVMGGHGEQLKMCGKPGRKGGVTFLCEEHKDAYSKQKE